MINKEMKPANIWREKESKWAQEAHESACHICSYWTAKAVVFLIADVQPAFAEWLRIPENWVSRSSLYTEAALWAPYRSNAHVLLM